MNGTIDRVALAVALLAEPGGKTLSELSLALGVSRRAVWRYVSGLRKAGVLRQWTEAGSSVYGLSVSNDENRHGVPRGTCDEIRQSCGVLA